VFYSKLLISASVTSFGYSDISMECPPLAILDCYLCMLDHPR